jgi:hypothetical protein
MKKQMKQKWEITVSGACKTFTGPELLATIKGTHYEASRERSRIEKTTGRIAYLALADNQ